DLNQNPAKWTRLKDSSYAWFTAAVYDYTSGHQTSGSDLVFDQNQTLYSYNPSTDSYAVLSNTMPYAFNANMDLDPVHHYLVMQDPASHLRLIDIDSCNGKSCKTTDLSNVASCSRVLGGYWDGITWDS